MKSNPKVGRGFDASLDPQFAHVENLVRADWWGVRRHKEGGSRCKRVRGREGEAKKKECKVA